MNVTYGVLYTYAHACQQLQKPRQVTAFFATANRVLSGTRTTFVPFLYDHLDNALPSRTRWGIYFSIASMLMALLTVERDTPVTAQQYSMQTLPFSGTNRDGQVMSFLTG